MAINLDGNFKKPRIQPEMNVTPLVDVVLVLLIIFMVLAPVMSKSFWVRLPPKDDKEEQLDAANDPSKPLVLTIDAEGKTLINKIEVERSELPRKLIRMLNARPDNTLYLDGADEAEFGHVLSAVDLAKEAQAWPIVFLTSKME
ncbi:biopolymer transporter ExbD [Nannocystis sp.]|uniref:ExbD/TolR family protein n=1 Tax=Nannocystis sp. TaxID=1962667 RepID=UPI0024221B4C|nr:biopolymer transporter ExbD [Nannocystis sp.]MBK7824659.1 biopolymer transporter ExbD [Nannocystis sp.]MBK9753091.1 biopolymer transporter ExbD [Nannocystis sp.]